MYNNNLVHGTKASGKQNTGSVYGKEKKNYDTTKKSYCVMLLKLTQTNNVATWLHQPFSTITPYY